MGTFRRMSASPITLWCLHGAVGAAADWFPFRDAMESHGYQVRAVDLWRFLDCCPRSLAETAISLNAEIQASAGENLLVGYSMGGRIALHCLLSENSPWDGAVIIGVHPGLVTEEEKIARRKIDTNWSVKCLHGEWETFLAEWQSQGILQDGGSLSERTPLRLRRKEIARSFLDWSLGAQENLWTRLREIKIPVLWLTGENDQKFTLLAERATALMPDARHQVIPAAGHRLPWQNAQAFTDAVIEFVDHISR
jgi:2-succinyl-6-hydroxy-2,4-cyclohexadiene-1-carboxylate synthase